MAISSRGYTCIANFDILILIDSFCRGEVVSVMDGPNFTRMRSKVLEECDKEDQVMAGASRRSSIAIEEAVPCNLQNMAA